MLNAPRPGIVVLLITGIAALMLTTCGENTPSSAWSHLSSKNGHIPVPGPSTQQTASLVLDVDKDGIDDFIIGSRVTVPSVLWHRRGVAGWTKYVINDSFLPIEAGGAFHDIDGDGDPDIVFGADRQSNKLWWWENPFPNYDPATPWTRREIKGSGANKHHDHISGDFDGDGQVEFVFWNHYAFDNVDGQGPEWTEYVIYECDEHHDGTPLVDFDGDGDLTSSRSAAAIAHWFSTKPRLLQTRLLRQCVAYPFKSQIGITKPNRKIDIRM